MAAGADADAALATETAAAAAIARGSRTDDDPAGEDVLGVGGTVAVAVEEEAPENGGDDGPQPEKAEVAEDGNAGEDN